jgi:hypothetical protein
MIHVISSAIGYASGTLGAIFSLLFLLKARERISLAAVAAGPVWKLFGLEGLGTDAFPAIDTPVGQSVGYHVRTGKHDLLEYDWLRFADFADRTLRGLTPPAADFRPVEPNEHPRMLFRAHDLPRLRARLATPLGEGRLAFAGEATDSRFAGTVAGAWLSGEAAAGAQTTPA